MAQNSDDTRLPVPGLDAPTLPGVLIAEIESAAAHAKASRARSTPRVYASDWKIFLPWCDARSIEPLPADPRAVATFLAFEADQGAKPATIGRRLAAIGYYHKQAGMQPPQPRTLSRACRREVPVMSRRWR